MGQLTRLYGLDETSNFRGECGQCGTQVVAGQARQMYECRHCGTSYDVNTDGIRYSLKGSKLRCPNCNGQLVPRDVCPNTECGQPLNPQGPQRHRNMIQALNRSYKDLGGPDLPRWYDPDSHPNRRPQ